jgi:ribosomal protein L11 methyltransferase
MGNYIHIRFHPVDKLQQEILIAQLADLGYEGFEEGANYLSAYIPEEQFNEQDISNYTFIRETIAPKNWNAEWEQNFQPVVIGSFCAVRAHFHDPITTVKHEVIITPKMSFGTGHHATTSLMIQAMEHQPFTGKTVLDFGTGTGILAILAEKLGSTAITAIDNDDWSINNAAENIHLNHCSNIHLQKADSLQMSTRFDVVLANINKHVILGNMAEIRQHLASEGVVYLSGLLSGDQPDIEAAANKAGMTLIDRKEKDSWICLTCKNFSTQ